LQQHPYSNKSTSALIVSYTTFSDNLKRLSGQFKKLQTGLQINSEVCEEIGTTSTMFGGIVDIYKHVAYCKHQKDFAGYIADLHTERSDIDMSKVSSALETNYLATKYFKVLDTLKHYTIALGVPPLFWEQFSQFKIEILQADSASIIKELSTVFTEILTTLQKKLLENNVFILKQDEFVKHDAEYTTNPWTFNEFHLALQQLIRGETLDLKLDSELQYCKLDLFMFKDVALKITHTDSTINGALQKFLSMKAEAVLTRSGQSKFRIGQSVYILPVSNPPRLTHSMRRGTQGNLSKSCNQVLGKLRDKKATPVLSPFGGTWSIKLKSQNLETPIILSPKGDLKGIAEFSL
jgi:hypothetical protein